jgi:ATP-dependent helicase HrpA
LRVAVYPTLVDTGDAVSLRLLDNPQQSQVATHAGMRRLFQIAAVKELRAQIAWLPEIESLLMLSEPLPRPASSGRESPGALTSQLKIGAVVAPKPNKAKPPPLARDLRDDLADLLADRTFMQAALPRTESEFDARLRAGRRELPAIVYDVTKLVSPLLKAYREAVETIDATTAPNMQRSVDDARAQLARLTPPGFLAGTPWLWLEQYPRYFRALTARLKKLAAGGLSRDVQAMAQIDPLWQRYEQRSQRLADFGVHDPELVLFRWMTEEFRVSLFAQELGTLMTVSPQRLDKQWAKVRET